MSKSILNTQRPCADQSRLVKWTKNTNRKKTQMNSIHIKTFTQLAIQQMEMNITMGCDFSPI